MTWVDFFWMAYCGWNLALIIALIGSVVNDD